MKSYKKNIGMVSFIALSGVLLSYQAFAISGTYPASPNGYAVSNNLGTFYKNSVLPVQTSIVGSYNTLIFDDSSYSLYNTYGNSSGRGSVSAGYSSGSNAVYNNTLTVESGRANYLFGGYNNNSGNAFYNKITINDGIAERVYAGYSNKGNAFSNTLNITGGQTNSWTFAGRSNSGNAYNNILNMSGGTVTYISGGRSATGEAYSNTVNVSGGTITDDVTGARSYRTAYLYDNTVNITGGAFLNGANTYITGGYSNQGLLENNVVNVRNTNFPDFSDGVAIYGSTTFTGTVKSNTVNIYEDVNLENNIIAGGHSYTSGAISGNTVYFNDTPITNTNTMVYGGQSASGNVSSNNVIMGSTNQFNGTIAGGYSTTGIASGNFVLIGNGTYSSSARIYGGQTVSGDVSNNNISIAGGTFEDGSHIAGGFSESGDVTGNKTTVNGGTFEAGSIVAASVDNGHSVSGNILTINGGTFEAGSIIAGTIVYPNAVPNGTNTIELNGGSFPTASIVGAVDTSGNLIDTHYNNTILSVKTPTELSNISNVGQFKLFVRDHKDPVSTPMIKANNIDFGTGATVQALIGSYGDDLAPGDTFNLFSSSTTFTGMVGDAYATQGMSLIGELEYVPSEGNLTVKGITAHPHSRTFPEARLASFSFLNQTDDLMLGQGVASALEATRKFPNNKWRTFAAIDLGQSHYNTDEGSTGDISYSGVSMVTGASKRLAYDKGKLMLAGYFETGYASTEVDNDDNDLGNVSTDGNISFYGLGLVSRYDLKDGMYISGLARVGMVHNKFKTKDEFTRFEYTNNTPYYGLGVNYGYQFEINNTRDNIDLYSRYMWTGLASQDEEFDGQNYDFESINSHQLRIGAQYNLMTKENLSYVIGLAGQYEFDGITDSNVNGFAITSPDIKGFTGMLELGMRIRSLQTPSFTSSLSFEGFLGARDGASATLDFTYSF